MSIIKMRYDKYKVQAQLFNAFSFIFRTNWAKEVYNETTFIVINFFHDSMEAFGCNDSGANASIEYLYCKISY